jgi:hypothetical protein
LRSFVLALVSVLCLAAPLSALDRSGTIMEARVYFDDVRTLRQLGDLAGQLDICTWVKDELGGYLLINTDAAQLEQIRAAGLLVDVTYPDIRQKFYEMTGIAPGDFDAGRNFGYFLTYYEMQDTLQKLADNFPAVCVRTTLGLTPQGRQMWCLKISDNPGTTEVEPAVFINAASHAREPLGTSTCVAFATKLLTEYGSDSVSTWLVNSREIYIVPVMNPDGYVFNSDSGGSQSNWRKNRRGPVPPNVGIDLNRNYGYKWGYDNQGSSNRPQDETYRGPSRFSETETQLVRDFLAQFQPHNCMDFHTFGQYNMYPWGYASGAPPDQAVLEEAVDTFQVNNHYPMGNTGQVNQTIYACNGLSVDWEYSDTASKFVTYAYTCELGENDFWYGYNDSNYIRSEVNLNLPNLYYLTRLAGVYFEKVSVTVDDSTDGNGNGQLDPGELSGIWFTVKNRAMHPLDSATGITARLIAGDARVTVLDSNLAFPTALRRTSVNDHATQFHVLASETIPTGTHVPLRLEITYTNTGHTYVKPVDFEVVIGSNPVAVAESPAPLYPSRLTATPNPARARVMFSTAPVAAAGRLDIFSTDGSRLVSTSVSGPYTWDCSRVPAGVYFCRLAANRNSVTTRVSVTH